MLTSILHRSHEAVKWMLSPCDESRSGDNITMGLGTSVWCVILSPDVQHTQHISKNSYFEQKPDMFSVALEFFSISAIVSIMTFDLCRDSNLVICVICVKNDDLITNHATVSKQIITKFVNVIKVIRRAASFIKSPLWFSSNEGAAPMTLSNFVLFSDRDVGSDQTKPKQQDDMLTGWVSVFHFLLVSQVQINILLFVLPQRITTEGNATLRVIRINGSKVGKWWKDQHNELASQQRAAGICRVNVSSAAMTP